MPATAVTFRGVGIGATAAVQVTGSVSGAHALTAKAHRDGLGVTLQPRVPFVPGEEVTVRGVVVAGGSGGGYSFTVARPGRNPGLDVLAKEGLVAAPRATSPSRTSTSTGRSGRTAEGPPYRTRPDLVPPAIAPTTPGTSTAPGLLLTTPLDARGGGEMLLDNRGQPVWYRPAPSQVIAGNLEKVRHRGRDALVWFEGLAPYGPGSYRGTWTMVDSAYHTIATIRAANGMETDIHDIDVNSAGRAYIDIYNPVIRDLSAYGGSRTANVLELVIQEIDIASGDLIFEWHSLDSFPVTDSYEALTNVPVDYLHGNSVSQDTDGNLLVSARHTSTVFKINRSTGQVMWRLGGKRNQFSFSPAGEPGPSYQHNALRTAPGVISIFDNGYSIAGSRASRGVQYQVDEVNHVATRVKQQEHNPAIFAGSQGNYQLLPSDHSLVSWGNTGVVTEFDAAGGVRFEATVPGTYRAFRQTWSGRPASLPAVVGERRTGHDTVFVSWNGATDVASWEVLAGPGRSSLASVARVPRDGFETAINIPYSSFAAVRGRAADGSVLGTSAVVPIGPWFSEHATLSASGVYRPFTGNFTGGAGDDVLFYGPGTTRDYLWTAAADGTFVDSATPAVNGDYRPLVGDFVGDSHDDILWWQRGSTRAYLWRSDGTGGFADAAIGVPATAVASMLRHRAGKAEVLWYNPGRPRDLISGYRWDGAGEPTGVRRSISVSGTYRPVIGDFDGNGWADIVWYAAGSTVDHYWRLSGTPGGASSGQVESTVPINGSYSPLVGRFSLAHDPRDDIVWYARGSAPDFLWEGTSGAGFDETTHTNGATGDPLLLHGAMDHLYLRTSGADGIIWVPNSHPDLIRRSGNTALGSEYQPVVGDFTGTGRSGILWYAPGTQSERLFSPRLG